MTNNTWHWSQIQLERSKWKRKINKETRLCDNLDCWNLIEKFPSDFKEYKHHFCSKRCHGIWISVDDHCSSKKPGAKEKLSKSTKRRFDDPKERKRQSDFRKNWCSEHRDLISGPNASNWKGGPTEVLCDWCGNIKSTSRRDTALDKLHFCTIKCQHEYQSTFIRGPTHPAWKGGLSFEPYCPKWNKDLRIRIRAWFNYECIICNKTTKENKSELCCHHVEYNKQACCDGKLVHFAALCRSCHNKTNNNRERWEEMFHRIIDEIYDGRSYYTKEEWKELTNISKFDQ